MAPAILWVNARGTRKKPAVRCDDVFVAMPNGRRRS
jgi:hypothetical protein